MNKISNWPDVDYGHSNWTLRTPRVSKWDGQGSWEKDSSEIPMSAWVGAVAVVAALTAISFIGTAAGL